MNPSTSRTNEEKKFVLVSTASVPSDRKEKIRKYLSSSKATYEDLCKLHDKNSEKFRFQYRVTMMRSEKFMTPKHFLLNYFIPAQFIHPLVLNPIAKENKKKVLVLPEAGDILVSRGYQEHQYQWKVGSSMKDAYVDDTEIKSTRKDANIIKTLTLQVKTLNEENEELKKANVKLQDEIKDLKDQILQLSRKRKFDALGNIQE